VQKYSGKTELLCKSEIDITVTLGIYEKQFECYGQRNIKPMSAVFTGERKLQPTL